MSFTERIGGYFHCDLAEVWETGITPLDANNPTGQAQDGFVRVVAPFAEAWFHGQALYWLHRRRKEMWFMEDSSVFPIGRLYLDVPSTAEEREAEARTEVSFSAALTFMRYIGQHGTRPELNHDHSTSTTLDGLA